MNKSVKGGRSDSLLRSYRTYIGALREYCEDLEDVNLQNLCDLGNSLPKVSDTQIVEMFVSPSIARNECIPLNCLADDAFRQELELLKKLDKSGHLKHEQEHGLPVSTLKVKH